jgi:DNA-binding MarR family transcriptional regulator
MSLTKLEVLQYLFSNAGATVKDLADEFSYREGSIRAYMNTLNSRGLVKKVKEDRKQTYFLTNSGKQRLDFLEEKLESVDGDDDFDENLEVKTNTGGRTKMKVVLNLDRDVYDAIGEWASDNKQDTIPEAIEEIVTSFLEDEGLLEVEDESEEE